MWKLLGFIVAGAGVLSLVVFFFASSLPGEHGYWAAVADYGSSSTGNPRSMFLLAGVALVLIGGAISRKR